MKKTKHLKLSERKVFMHIGRRPRFIVRSCTQTKVQASYNPFTGAIKATGRPDYEGQLVNFYLSNGAVCCDVAEKDKHGKLIWVALEGADHRAMRVKCALVRAMRVK